jgi:putative methyltransferase (TIGR04325 family)
LNVREIVKGLTPPLVLQAVRRSRAPATIPAVAPEYSDDFPSFEAAAAACVGYNTDESTDLWVKHITAAISGPKTDIHVLFQQVHSAFCFARDKMRADNLSVLDIGGNNGIYFVWFRKLMPSTELDWAVQETPKVVTACAPLLPEITFTTEFPDRHFDIALISGTLHCLPSPEETLTQAANASRWIVLTRVPIHDGPEDRFKVQTVPDNIYNGSHPVRISSKEKLENRISEIGEIALAWAVDWDTPSLAIFGARSIGYLIRVRNKGLPGAGADRA